MYHENVNVSLMIENVTQIKSAKIQKNIMCAKKIILGILLHVLLKMVDMQEVLLTIQLLHVMKLKTLYDQRL